MTWFVFDQNNSGGRWLLPGQLAVVEANSQDQAWERFMATSPNMSFCRCCGERWYNYAEEFSARPEPKQLSLQHRAEPGVPWIWYLAADGTESTVEWSKGGGRG